MEITNIAFDFSPIGRNSKSQRRSAVTGMTMTVYDSRFSLTTDVLETLGNPDKVSISYNAQLEAFAVFADENGMPVSRKGGGGKTYRIAEVKEILQKNGCDFFANFYRIQNGRKYGKYILFSMNDIIEIKREARNGIN